jgi:hypothetical protein
MIFAGIDVNIITHEKAEEAGIEAFGLWWAQVHASDGRVPRVLALRALGGKRNIMLAKRLVEVGLWVANDDGSWTIWNYTKKNQSAEDIQKKKAAAKARKDLWKQRQAERGNAEGTRSGTQEEHVPERPLPLQLQTPIPIPTTTTQTGGGESAPAGNASGSRCLRVDEPLTDQRRKDFESETQNLPARDIEPEWRNYVDDRISRTMLFASVGAVDADWRKWVRRQNVIEAKDRIKAQNDNAPSGKRGGRQPLGDNNAKWLKTGSDL